ncbi:hypothetical protein JCM11641_000951 [Rhodosporidiobolus odoratus]
MWNNGTQQHNPHPSQRSAPVDSEVGVHWAAPHEGLTAHNNSTVYPSPVVLSPPYPFHYHPSQQQGVMFQQHPFSHVNSSAPVFDTSGHYIGDTFDPAPLSNTLGPQHGGNKERPEGSMRSLARISRRTAARYGTTPERWVDGSGW